jgi:hypothetical protein
MAGIPIAPSTAHRQETVVLHHELIRKHVFNLATAHPAEEAQAKHVILEPKTLPSEIVHTFSTYKESTSLLTQARVARRGICCGLRMVAHVRDALRVQVFVSFWVQRFVVL